MDSLVKEKIGHYRTAYELPFIRLVSTYQQLELRLIDDIISIVKYICDSFGYQDTGNLCCKGNHCFTISCEYHKNTRMLHIKLYPVTFKANSNINRVTINHFGLIRDIAIEIPCDINIDAMTLIQNLKQLIDGAYNALETAFEANSIYLTEEVFRILQYYMRVQLKDSSKLHLENKYTLTIFNESEGFHFFDQPMMRDIINHFKNHQDEQLSPIELTIWLMTEPLPFSKSLTLKAFEEGRTIYQPWCDAKFIGDSYRFFQAAKTFHNFEEYGVYPICQRRGYFLSIGFARDLAADLIPEIDNIKSDLEHHFSEGIRNYSPYIKTINKVRTCIKESRSSIFIGEVIGTALNRFLS